LRTLRSGLILTLEPGADRDGAASPNPVGTRRTRMATEAYCVKCRAKRVMKDETAVTMKNGKPATQGVCPECGTKMFKIGKSK